MEKNTPPNSSKEHQNLVDVAFNKYGGEKVKVRGNNTIKGQYFPDVRTNEIDIECEILRASHLQKKVSKWNSKRKKILIVGLPKVALDNFQEIYCIDDKGNLYKVH